MADTFKLTEVLNRITADVQANQKPARVLHIFGVLQSCLSLGAIHDVNLEKLSLAALLHDCAKDVGREETIKLDQAGSISLGTEDKQFPAIWHGSVAAYMGRSRYGIADEEVLNAVEHHTVGCSSPSPLLQVLMCADFCEPTRQHPRADGLRRLIRKDLRAGLLTILKLKIEDLAERDQKPHSGIYHTIKSLES